MKKFLFMLLLLPSIVYGQGWQWARTSTGGAIDSWPVATDPSGNVFAAGINYSAVRNVGKPTKFGPYTVPLSLDSGYGYQTIITKYDADGNFLWFRETQNGSAWLINIAADQSGNSILFGTIMSRSVKIGTITLVNTIYPESPYFLAKFDPSGNVVWAVTAGNAQDDVAHIGGGVIMIGFGGIATDAMDNIYITANFHLPVVRIGNSVLTNADPSGTTDDILLAKYDSSGNAVWATSAVGSGDDDAYGLTVTPAGDIYIAGTFRSPEVNFGQFAITNATDTTRNAFIAEYNSSGSPVWANSSGGAGGEAALGIASDASGNVYMTGGLSDSIISFSGTTITNPYPGNSVLWLAKINSAHNVAWYKTLADTTGGDTWGFSIAMSPCGAIWVSGAFGNFEDTLSIANSIVNIDGNILHVPAGSKDPVFIAGFNTAGVYAGSAALQSGADDQNGIACDPQGNVYICADYLAVPFIAGNETFTDSPSAEWQYVAKYTFVDVADPDTFYTHRDTTVCSYGDIVLNAPPGYPAYLWDNGGTGPTTPVKAPGVYWVVGKGGCTVIDSITVRDDISLCPCEPAIPSAFTPNHDGRDDFFGPIFEPGCTITNYSFGIFNRFGQQVFSSENPQAKWDGTFWYINADVGAYMYYVKYTSGPNKIQRLVKGDVTLIR